MEECSLGRERPLPEYMCKVVTPLKLQAWQELLAGHPDQTFVGYILRGIERGFRVGFDTTLTQLKSRKTNMLSTLEHPQVIGSYVESDTVLQRIIKVDSPEEAEQLGIHCSSFGVIPKKNKPNKWRIIVDLSSPDGHSVNDGIVRELASLGYVSVDDVVDHVLELGKGTMLAKMDIKQAYRNVPVHPDDRPLLGTRWAGQVYMDAVLPFGLRSAPLIFSAVADAVQWIMLEKGASWLSHYIDDFVTLGPPNSRECETNMGIMHEVCEEVGLPVEPEKDEGPATGITFLGVELDTEALEIRLPAEKLRQMRSLLTSWRGRKACRKRELLSLIGVLTQAGRAVKAGRSFVRRLLDLAKSTRRLDQYVRLNRDARADIEWWCQYAEGITQPFQQSQ